ncbi:paraquat-inducible protein B [Vibrio comitans NBRC 102076]|uniref:Paraquat-inducible protein B n=1 Tax=Vibrio comitans NBRC 102076 TaxID=1219078 RepID=A0A4Y3IPH2_9VIBR|nr:paraquat-inducible protein B [Vibrio comitans NBRC 102076]
MWIIPLIAFAMGMWMLFQYVNSRGPEVTLMLPDAAGIEAGKTAIKARNVKVGTITEIELSENYEYIVAKAQMDKQAARMLREDSLFWVVEPHIGADGISGLDTLLSGSYIELKPGRSDKQERKFKVLELPPVAGPDAKGIRVILTHNEANKLGIGEPVLHHGFTVGRVEKTSYNYEKQTAEYQLFIFAPYDSLVFEHSQFWLDSGVEVKLDTSGIDLKVGSLETILTGGVSFDVPENIQPGSQVTTSLQQFELFNDYNSVLENKYSEYLHYALLFSESVRGLETGAPVEYRGIRIGTVETVPLAVPMQDDGTLSNRIPVLIRIEIERVSEVLRETTIDEFKQRLEYQVQRGLRGALRVGNLLTGALYIDVDFYEKPDPVEIVRFAGYETFPVISGGFSEIQKQAVEFLHRVNNLPLEETVTSLNKTLHSAQVTLNSASKVANDIDVLLSDNQTKQLPGQLNQSLEQLQTTLEGFDVNSQMYQQLQSAISEVEQVMQQLKPILQEVNEKPNALVFGDDSKPDPVPVRGNQ